jgi:hypothetical protein
LRETLPEWFARKRRPAFWREHMTTRAVWAEGR